MKILIPLAALSLTACTGQGEPGRIPPAQNICAAASQAGAAADIIAQSLLAAGIGEAKVGALVPLIQTGRLLVTATCAILVPAG